MAVFTVKTRLELAPGHVLAPERYDPRRAAVSAGTDSVELAELAFSAREIVQPSRSAVGGLCRVLDTTDVREGVITPRHEPMELARLGSSKKRIRAGDVLISRLRPYLRQVGYVDSVLVESNRDAELVCSTELIVLRAKDAAPLAFLVPWLLSSPVQAALAVGQEGGHHPRFDESMLFALPLSRALLDRRESLSREVESAIFAVRAGHDRMAKTLAWVDALWSIATHDR